MSNLRNIAKAARGLEYGSGLFGGQATFDKVVSLYGKVPDDRDTVRILWRLGNGVTINKISQDLIKRDICLDKLIDQILLEEDQS